MKLWNVTIKCSDGRTFTVKNVHGHSPEHAQTNAWKVHPSKGGVPFGWSMVGIKNLKDVHEMSYEIQGA